MVLLDTYHVCLFCLGTVLTSYNTCWNDLDTSHACQVLVVIKTLDMQKYLCIKTYLYITRDFSSSLAIEMYKQPFFFRNIPK